MMRMRIVSRMFGVMSATEPLNLRLLTVSMMKKGLPSVSRKSCWRSAGVEKRSGSRRSASCPVSSTEKRGSWSSDRKRAAFISSKKLPTYWCRSSRTPKRNRMRWFLSEVRISRISEIDTLSAHWRSSK